MNLTPWFIAIGWPNCSRSLRVLDRVLEARPARRPTAPAAVPGRVWSSVCIAILKPSPSSPSRFAAGTCTSWNASAEVSVARWPILSRCFSTVTPVGVARRRRRRSRPRWPGVAVGRGEDGEPGGVAGVGDEHLRAVEDVLVAVADGRGLDPGDVGAGVRLGQRERAEDRLLEQRRQPLALLLLGAGEQHRQRAEDVGDDRRRRSRSSPSRAPRRSARPRSRRGPDRRAPPGCAGSSARPRAPSRSRRPGWVWCSSYSAATGRISLSANSCASSRSARCSAVSSKETPVPTVSCYRAHTSPRLLID